MFRAAGALGASAVLAGGMAAPAAAASTGVDPATIGKTRKRPNQVTSAYARLGKDDNLTWQQTGWENVTATPGDGNGALASTVTTRAGVGCWTTSTGAGGNDFIYFKVAPGYKPTAPGGNALVQVVYFDAGPGNFTIHYAGARSDYVTAEIVPLTGGNVWRTHTFELTDIYFNGQQTIGADFRISSWDPAFGRSPTDVAVSDVAISFADFYPHFQVSVVSPEVGSTIHGTEHIDFYAPGMKNVWARAQHQPDATHSDVYDSWFQNVIPDPETGFGRVKFPARSFPRGPLTVMLSAWDSAPGDPNFAHSDTFYLQLNNLGGVSFNEGIPATTPPPATGMRVVYADDFTGPLSISRTGAGATYAAQKPDPNEASGGGEFGDAIFADPAGPNNPFAIVNNQYLRIRSTRTPAGTVDPRGWDRRFFGGLLSSLRFDGTGVAVQDGYFEARMLAPGGKGTWPAFWLMPQAPVATGDPSLAAVEVDVTELYGNQETKSYATYHLWNADPQIHEGTNVAFPSNNPTFTGWHVYGAKVTATDTIYYIDHVEIWRHATAPQGNTPMFFMINLALGSGWPINITSKYRDQVDLYVDYVRVFAP
ncbi:glycoside hydrolase family 16 protein [Actinopolymorpha pittospori]|uniref:GH16 domain-containing protein n=1 Tax=Actinopolymorpha pittospori TaxID=648752 RepID=A0A927MS10_9ACTN|nr:glycoside hydrolase family 16 protein [Actinopolymorpha pittospori]MBE1603823.1 hypothetical protein [Actinopolymorpha pittospori]